MLKAKKDPIVVGNDNFPKIPLWLIYYSVIANGVSMMTMDIHLPALPQITKDLNTTFFASQMILIIFYTVGIFARILLGPLSDAYGRKKIMLLTLNIQVIGQAMQTVAPNIQILLIGRVIQALASGGLTIVISAMISDLFTGRQRTKMLSLNELAQPLSFVIAPVIGAFLTNYLGWRSGFFFLLINLVIARIVMGIYMVETNFVLKPASFKSMASDYKTIFSNKRFMSHNVIMAFIVATYMMYTVCSSYIYIIKFGLSISEFAVFQSTPLLCQSLIALSYSKFNLKSRVLINVGVSCMIASAILSLCIVLGIAPYNQYSLLMCIVILCMSLGFIFPACMKKSLDVFPDIKGTAVSSIVVTRGLLSGITMICASILVDVELIIPIGIVIATLLTVVAWKISKIRIMISQQLV